MKTLSRFVTKFTNLIVAVLSCFDRVIFKGYLPFTNGPALEGFVDHVLKIRRCDFMAFAEKQSEIWSTTPSAWPRRPAPNTDFFKAFIARTNWSTRSFDNGRSSRAWSASSVAWNAAPASRSSPARIAPAWSTSAGSSASCTSTSWWAAKEITQGIHSPHHFQALHGGLVFKAIAMRLAKG